MEEYKLTNENGLELTVIPFGATLKSLKIPLKNGKKIDVVLGFDITESYKKSFDLAGPPYMGATVGRYAGRISRGSFTLNGKEYQLYLNNNGNSLHGGKENFSKKEWIVSAENKDKNPSLTLSYSSSDGEENYPGKLEVGVTYTLTERNELVIEYNAQSSEDTVINLTHHSYFNLDGHQGSIEKQQLTVMANEFVETDSDNIPTGKLIDLKNHKFNFNSPKNCPKSIDNTFVITDNNKVVASLFSSINNLKMEVITTQPSVHIYVGGNCEGVLKGKENVDYHALSGICFETQNFPDAPNHDNFPNAVLKKNEKYYHKTIYRFSNL